MIFTGFHVFETISIYMCICIYICTHPPTTHTYTHTHIFIEREREREYMCGWVFYSLLSLRLIPIRRLYFIVFLSVYFLGFLFSFQYIYFYFFSFTFMIQTKIGSLVSYWDYLYTRFLSILEEFQPEISHLTWNIRRRRPQILL